MFIPAAIFFGLFLYEREMKNCVWLDFVSKKLGSCLQSFCRWRNESCGGGGWHHCIAFHEAVAQFWWHRTRRESYSTTIRQRLVFLLLHSSSVCIINYVYTTTLVNDIRSVHYQLNCLNWKKSTIHYTSLFTVFFFYTQFFQPSLIWCWTWFLLENIISVRA